MTHIKGLLILIMGIGLVLVALQGLARGWLPDGPKGFEQGEGVSREQQPIGFWFFFILYAGGGAAAAVWALRHF